MVVNRACACHLIVALLGALAIACGSQNRSVTNAAEAYGLTESYSYRDEVERAIILSDLVLEPAVPFRFVATWQHARWYPEVRATEATPRATLAYRPHHDGSLTYDFRGYRAIPVYVVDGAGNLGARETTFVPPDARCVFVNARALPALLDGFAVAEPSAWQRYSVRERAAAIAVVLLHEAGHIVANDGGSYGGIGGNRVVNPTAAAVRREVEADRFATTQIARGLVDATVDKRELLEGGRGRAANTLFYIVQLAWAAHDGRAYMAANPAAAREELYRPAEPSHLNLHLRFEVMQYDLEPSADRKADLRARLGDAVDASDFAPVGPTRAVPQPSR
jgi:hypothetical protein